MPCEILDVAIHGLMNIVDGCKYNKIKELYLASSSEVPVPEKIPTSEDSAILKILIYIILDILMGEEKF